MIIHRNTLISEDLFERYFICDLHQCKGACCVEGDFGAPLQQEEVDLIKDDLRNIMPFLSEEGKAVITTNGVVETDKEGDLVTTCRTTGECCFAIYENGLLSCGMEKAYQAGNTNFIKPLSCHLYPIRINKVGIYDALNFHKWDICNCALKLGNQNKIPVFRFLKNALIRKYGEDWFMELEQIYEAYLLEKNA